MSSITAQEQTVRQRVLEKLWKYVDANFENFTDANKLKIVVVLCAKSMPQVVEGNYNVTKMSTVKIDDKEQELPFGRATGVTTNSN
jgi:Cys-tRNA synthase (O-phospho-L-seryl-tRNA:Cys-tRNA synthase)